jgi:hypothetical protein
VPRNEPNHQITATTSAALVRYLRQPPEKDTHHGLRDANDWIITLAALHIGQRNMQRQRIKRHLGKDFVSAYSLVWKSNLADQLT